MLFRPSHRIFLYQISHLPVKKNHWMTGMPGYRDFTLQAPHTPLILPDQPTESHRISLTATLRLLDGRPGLEGITRRDFASKRLRVGLRAKQTGPVLSESVQAPYWCGLVVSATQLSAGL